MIPPELAWLFWEVEVVMERVMARGDWAAMQWLVATFPSAA